MESFKFITPARVKLSLVPLSGIPAGEFRRYAETIQTVTDIRLLDVSPIPECRHFNPQEFPQGRIFYIPSVESPNDDAAFLEEFEPFRKTFIVIGIGSQPPSMQKQEKALASLKAQYPAAIVHSIIYYKSSVVNINEGEIFHINEESEKITTSIETVICGVTRTFLKALDAYASSSESITLRSPISLTDSSVLTRTINQAQKRLSSGSAFKTSFSNGQSVTPSPKDSKLKFQQRQTGRQAKLMGNFFLLAGRVHDALQYFTDAAINAKKVDDHLWLASALEGLSVSATILSFLGLPHQIQNPMFANVLQLPKSRNMSLMKGSSKVSMESMVSRQSISAVTPRNSTSSTVSLGAHQLNSTTDVSQIQIIEFLLLLASRSSHYYKASASDVEDCVPDLVYVESLLRNIKLMVIVFLSSTSDSDVIMGALIGCDSIRKQRGGADFHLSLNPIISEIDQIFALQLNQLDLAEQCRIYCALASIYDDLGLHRKHGLVLCLLLRTLTPKASMIEQHTSPNDMGGLKSIKNIIEVLFKIYHLDKETEKSESSASSHYSDWIVLQLSLIKLCLRVAEAFQDHDTLMKLCILTLSRFTHCLPVDDQIKLRDKLSWLSLVADSGIKRIKVPHPDPFLVRDAKFIVMPRATSLVPFPANKTLTDVKAHEASNSTFFDPFTKSAKTLNMDRVICQNEVYQLKVVLQNPFFYSLDIHSMNVVAEKGFEIETLASLMKVASISPLNHNQDVAGHGWKSMSRNQKPTNDPNDVSDHVGFSIPACSAAEVIISFKALCVGPLQIHGFDITLDHCQSQFFDISDQENSAGLEKLTYRTLEKEDCLTLETLFSNLSMGKSGNRVSKKVVSLISISTPPTLSVINHSRMNDWSMLLEGESRSSSLQVKNCSNDAVNYLSISIWDSTSDSISSQLNSQNNLNASDVYELEWLLLEKKALCVTNKSEIASKHKVVQPGCQMTINYDIIGKRAMTESRLILEYGKRISDEQEESFLKTLVVPFNVSVHRSLEITASDVVPLFPSNWKNLTGATSTANGEPKQTTLDTLRKFISSIKASSTEEISNFCLLVLDIKNFWKENLAVKLTSDLGGKKEFTVETCIFPNKSARIFIPVRRLGGKSFDPFKPIPSLRNKQFIKNYNLSEEEENQMRRSFWVKNELLQSLQGRWRTTESFTQRSGDLDLRRIRLSSPMTNSLIYDSLSIFHQIYLEGANMKEAEVQNNKCRLDREKFYILKTRIVNHTQRPISGILRHVPFPLNVSSKQDISIDQKILYNGVLQIHIGGNTIAPGQTYERELGFMILEKGQYEWGCIFDESGEQAKRTFGREPIYIIAS